MNDSITQRYIETKQGLIVATEMIISLQKENSYLKKAILETLAENGHLADGENCTLIKLKRALGVE